MTALLGLRFVVTAGLLAGAIALVIGLPTDVVPNPWFTRMTPVRPADILLLVVTSMLVGLLAATYASRWSHIGGLGHPASPVASGTLGWLAIGCPLCNKIVLALLGTSGSLSYFAPIQPVLGALAVLLAGFALRLRLRRMRTACSVSVGL